GGKRPSRLPPRRRTRPAMPGTRSGGTGMSPGPAGLSGGAAPAHSLAQLPLAAGWPAPLGATPMEGGVNFALFSAHAERVQLCLFSPDGTREVRRVDLMERDGDVWHVFVAGLGAGQRYG